MTLAMRPEYRSLARPSGRVSSLPQACAGFDLAQALFGLLLGLDEPMTLNVKERRALEAAQRAGGVDKGELSKIRVGIKTIARLLKRGLLLRIPDAAPEDTPVFQTTEAGKDALAVWRRPG